MNYLQLFLLLATSSLSFCSQDRAPRDNDDVIAELCSSEPIDNLFPVQGPPFSTINAVARYGNNSRRSLEHPTVLKNSKVLVDDDGNVTLNGITKDNNTVSWPETVGAVGTFLFIYR